MKHQADGEANVKGAKQRAKLPPHVADYRRFTRQEVAAGHATGWRFAAGWFRISSFEWAWFEREVGDG